MRKAPILFLLLAAACGPAADSQPPVAPPAPTTPVASATATARPAAPAKPAPVVVAIIVDQLGAWVADERLPKLPDTGGFARLRREGTWVRDMHYAHAVTDTAPGHSALYTGVPPRRSGIYGNEAVDPKSRERVSILHDPSSRTLLSDGAHGGASSSLAILQVPTVADRFRAAHPDADIVSLSLKDRGALFAGGRHPSASLWYSSGKDAFVTSTAVAGAYPAWAARAQAGGVVTHLRDAPWTLGDARSWVAENARQVDAQPGEGDIDGFGITFPHAFSASKNPRFAMKASPRGDAAVLMLARAALAAHNLSHPMLLALSLSSNDYVGHVFGPDSWEAWDFLRTLDAALGSFFDALDARVGKDGWSLVLTGDHGSPTLPELLDAKRPWCKKGAPADPWERPCGKAERLYQDKLAKETQAAAVRAVGKGDWIRGVADPYVFYTDAAVALPAAKKAKLGAAVIATLDRHFGVDKVIPWSGEACPAQSDESRDALVCRALPPKDNHGLFVLQKRGSFFDPDYVVGKGISHGSTYPFDRSVPLLVRAPGRAKAGDRETGPVSFASFTRTLSSLLGVAPPPGCFDGKDFAPRH